MSNTTFTGSGDDVVIQQARENHYAMMTKHNHLVYRLGIITIISWASVVMPYALSVSWVDAFARQYFTVPAVLWLVPLVCTAMWWLYMNWCHKMQIEESSKYLTALDQLQSASMQQTEQVVESDKVSLLRRKDGSVVASAGSK